MTFKYTDQEELLIRQNSIERVINTTIKILSKCPQDNDLVGINTQDWLELKAITVKLWDDKRNEIMKRLLGFSK